MSFLRFAGRYVAGLPLDGERRTDATFWRPGSIEVRPHWFGRRAGWWSMLAGWQRSAVRLLGLGLVVVWWQDHQAGEWAAALVLGPATGWLAWRAVRGVQLGRHRAGVVRPLAAALAPALEASPVEVERSLWVPRNHGHPSAQITALLAPHWQGQPAQTDSVARILGQRLGGEWVTRVSRSPLLLVASHAPAPPGLVPFAQVAPLIRAQGSATRILMGLGAGDEPVWLDFRSALAHLGLSVGTGGGKSTFLRLVLAQFAYWGVAQFPCLDAKGVSLAGMESIPGLAIYRTVAEQWGVIAALRAEMESRYAAQLADRAATFPLCVVLCDEMNTAAISWRAYWDEIRPARSPATPPIYADLTRLLITGRECGFRVIGAYQRLTAAACGGINAGVMRDAYGTKALARFSTQAFDSLVGTRPRPESSQVPGRWVVAAGHGVRSVQVPNADVAELLEFVASSPHAAAAGVPVPPVVYDVPAATGPVPVQDTGPAVDCQSVVVGLADAADRLRMQPESFRKARQRSPIDGEFRTADGRPAWPVDALTAWQAARPVAGQQFATEGVA